MAFHWARWIIVEQNKLSFNLMSFELTCNMGILLLQRQTPPAGRTYCMYCIDCDGVSVLILFYGAALDSWLVVFMKYSSRSGVKQVSLRSISYGVLLCVMRFTRSYRFGGIATYLMNGTMEINHQEQNEIEVRHDRFLGL